MRKKLSSSLTFFLKFVVAPFILVFTTMAVLVGVSTNGMASIIILIPLFIIYFSLNYFLFGAKVVEIDDKYLYVSNFREEARIPLSNIKTVSDKVFVNPRPIFITFKKETTFGDKIMFIGKKSYFLFFSAHPAVKEIKDRVEKNK